MESIMPNITPSKYLKECKKEFQNAPAVFYDTVIALMLNPEGGKQVLIRGINTEDVNEKYHDRVNRVFQLIALNILFKGGSSKYPI
jgi:hypothetical protein